MPDPRIDSNDKRNNPNVTVFEWLNRKPGLSGQDNGGRLLGRLPFYFQHRAQRTLYECRLGTFGGPALADRQVLLNKLITQAPGCGTIAVMMPSRFRWRSSICDKRVRVFYVGLGDTDEHAHSGRYDKYLHASP